jgi:hypothetical protein
MTIRKIKSREKGKNSFQKRLKAKNFTPCYCFILISNYSQFFVMRSVLSLLFLAAMPTAAIADPSGLTEFISKGLKSPMKNVV